MAEGRFLHGEPLLRDVGGVRENDGAVRLQQLAVRGVDVRNGLRESILPVRVVRDRDLLDVEAVLKVSHKLNQALNLVDSVCTCARVDRRSPVAERVAS